MNSLNNNNILNSASNKNAHLFNVLILKLTFLHRSKFNLLS